MILALVSRRVLGAVVLVAVASILVFAMMEVIPGDPAFFVAGKDAPPELIAQVRQSLGLDRPVTTRYFDWVSHMARGDFGQSAVLVGQNLNAYLKDRMRNTAILCGVTLALLIPLALVLGVMSAVRRDGLFDHSMSGIVLFSVGFPRLCDWHRACKSCSRSIGSFSRNRNIPARPIIFGMGQEPGLTGGDVADRRVATNPTVGTRIDDRSA